MLVLSIILLKTRNLYWVFSVYFFIDSIYLNTILLLDSFLLNFKGLFFIDPQVYFYAIGLQTINYKYFNLDSWYFKSIDD